MFKQEHSENADLLGQATPYPHIAQIPGLESEHGDPVAPKISYLFFASLQRYPEILKNQNPLRLCWVIARFLIE